MIMDQCAKFIIDELQRNGYEAYVVGGCIRDYIMGRTPHDWDICTNAFSITVHNIFNKLGIPVIDTGIKYGTVGILISPTDIGIITQNDAKYSLDEFECKIYEVTTFRSGGAKQKESIVEFGDSIETDLARRDFTINGMAFNNRVGLIDLFNGQQDIKDRIIRCIGNPYDRFSEDKIRVLRAIRFQAQLGFKIEENTKNAAYKMAELIDDTSKERIQAELNKLLLGDFAEEVFIEHTKIIQNIIPELKETIGFNQNNPHHRYTVYEHLIKTLGVIINEGNKDIETRMAALLHDIGKPNTYTIDSKGIGHFKGHAKISAVIAKNILNNLGYSESFIKNVIWLIENHDRHFLSKNELKKFMKNTTIINMNKLINLKHADILAQSNYKIDEKINEIIQIRNWIKEIKENNEEFKISDLEITGKDLIKLGYIPGVEFGTILNNLLDLVTNDKICNTKDALVDYVINHYKIPKV